MLVNVSVYHLITRSDKFEKMEIKKLKKADVEVVAHHELYKNMFFSAGVLTNKLLL